MSCAPSPARAIRVLVADANRMASEMLTRTLNNSRGQFAVVASVWDAPGVMATLSRKNVDVALLSAGLADGAGAGLTLLRHLCAAYPRTRAILLVESPESDLVVDAFRSGSRGIFCRNEPLSHLRKCISTVHRGQIWANTVQLESILQALQQACLLRVVDAKGQDLLAPREMEVVGLVTEGLTNREIGRRLSLTEHTVRNYLFRIFEKLGISSRVELVLYALSQREHLNGNARKVV